MIFLVGQIDYAMILTIFLVGWAFFYYELINLNFNEWVIMLTFFALPVAILYWLLKAMFVALGFMSRI
jgi:hypothetical protein